MTDQDRTVLIVGATGRQGGAAARALLDRGWRVRALVRDPAAVPATRLSGHGAVLATGDLDDPPSLAAAMNGVYGVFLTLPSANGPLGTADDVAAEGRRGRAVAEQAARAGVRHLVYGSAFGADTGIAYYDGKAAIEQRLRALAVPSTILRPVPLMDDFASLTRPALVGGEIVVRLALAPDTPLPLIAARDVGVFAAIALDRPDLRGAVLDLAGDVRTGTEIAEVFGRAAGRAGRFTRLPLDRLLAFDPALAARFAWLDGRPGHPDPAALRLLHPGLMTLEEWAASTGGWRRGELPFGGPLVPREPGFPRPGGLGAAARLTPPRR